MDIIQQAIEGIGKMLAKLLKKDDPSHELIIEQAQDNEISLLIGALLLAGDINGAESYLFSELEKNFELGLYYYGLDFYKQVSLLSKERLAECNYTEEEILEGINDLERLLKKHNPDT